MCKINPLYEQPVGLRFRALERLEQEEAPSCPQSSESGAGAR